MTHDPDALYPAEITPLARGLDELAAADGAAAGPDLEGRIAQALREARGAPSLRLAPQRTAGWLASPALRLAASVAIVAGGAAAWLAMRAGPPATDPGADPAPSLEQEVDAWLTLAGPDDGLSVQIETMLLQSADLARGLEAGWLEEDLMGESL
jgi:hypothetical protein